MGYPRIFVEILRKFYSRDSHTYPQLNIGISLEYPKLESIEMGLGYTMIIFFYSRTNNLGLGYLGITQDISGISHSSVQTGSFPAAQGLSAHLLVLLFEPCDMDILSPTL